MAPKLLLVPAVVASLLVPAADATARKKNWKWDGGPPGHSQSRVDDHKPAGGGDGRRMR